MVQALRKPGIRIFMTVVFTACVLAGCLATPEEKYRRLVDEGHEFFLQGRYNGALSVWMKALAIKRDDWRLLADIGTCHLKAADFPAAAKWYSEALKADPKAFPVWLELAKILMTRGDLEDARAALEEASALNPKEPNLLRLEGDVLLLERRPVDAETFYRRSLMLNPSDPLSLIRLASCLTAGNDRLGALQLIEGLPARSLEDPEILTNLAQFWRFSGDQAKAEKYFLAAAELRPNDLSLVKQLAEYYFQTENWERCEKYLQGLLATYPDDPAIRKLQVELLLARGALDEAEAVIAGLKERIRPDLELQLLEGKTHLMADRPVAAAGALEAAVNNEPKLAIGHYLLGLAYLQGGHLKLGQQSLMRALSLRKDYANAELVLAGSFYKEGDYPIAAQYLNRVCAREPENVRAHAMLGAVLWAQGEERRALAQFAMVRTLSPQSLLPALFELQALDIGIQPAATSDRPDRWYAQLLEQRPDSVDLMARIGEMALRRPANEGTAMDIFRSETNRTETDPFAAQLLGEWELARGRKERAQELFEQAVGLEPRLVSGYRRLLELAGRDAKARERVLQKWIQQVPQMSEPYIQLAQIRLQEGHPEKALTILKNAFKSHPESGLLANNLAWLVLQTGGNTDEALALAQAAFDRLPEDPDVMDTLALAYLRKNLPSRSLWLLSEAMAKKTGAPLLHFHAGLAYQAQGDKETARSSLQTALDLGLPMPERLEAQSLLSRLSATADTIFSAPEALSRSTDMSDPQTE